MRNHYWIFVVVLLLFGSLAILSVLALYASLCYLLDAALVRKQIIDNVALPTIAVAFAASVFPYQLGGTADTYPKRLMWLCGQSMFTGCIVSSAAYSVYWTLTSIPDVPKHLNEFFSSVAILLALIGSLAWICGLVVFYIALLLEVGEWKD